MFGYVVANKEIMSPDQLERYKACYCGLCRALRLERGSLSRVTLTYDMTFLVLFLSSMYEPEEESGIERCVMHPVKTHKWWTSPVTRYAADMNLALAYLNMLDDWKDERRVLRLLGSGMLSEEYFYVRQRYPEKCAFIEERLRELDGIEKSGETDPDLGAHCFGRIMGELFSYQTDSVWGGDIRDFGQALGEFVYVMDAVCDLDGDIKKGRYNPMRSLRDSGSTEDDLRYILTMLIGECAMRFERLPIVRDADIIRNVLYSGVWLRYNALMEKKRGETPKKGDATSE